MRLIEKLSSKTPKHNTLFLLTDNMIQYSEV